MASSTQQQFQNVLAKLEQKDKEGVTKEQVYTAASIAPVSGEAIAIKELPNDIKQIKTLFEEGYRESDFKKLGMGALYTTAVAAGILPILGVAGRAAKSFIKPVIKKTVDEMSGIFKTASGNTSMQPALVNDAPIVNKSVTENVSTGSSKIMKKSPLRIIIDSFTKEQKGTIPKEKDAFSVTGYHGTATTRTKDSPFFNIDFGRKQDVFLGEGFSFTLDPKIATEYANMRAIKDLKAIDGHNSRQILSDKKVLPRFKSTSKGATVNVTSDNKYVTNNSLIDGVDIYGNPIEAGQQVAKFDLSGIEKPFIVHTNKQRLLAKENIQKIKDDGYDSILFDDFKDRSKQILVFPEHIGKVDKGSSLGVAKEINKDMKLAKGGTVMNMNNQMEMFEDGGLKDEGGMVDEVSGNDVPIGSTREEVRDDIPAQLSEGEFVFPADVVRFMGLEKLMMMRQKAKMGLQKMEDMGQMGNSDEATMPDDMPFDINDLDMEDEIEYNRGGVLKAAVGTYVPPSANAYDPTKNVYGGTTNETVTPYMPKPAGILGSSDPKNLVGGIPADNSDMFEQRRYVNEATGQVRFVSFNKETGQTTTNVKQLLDEGFIRQDEAIKEAAKTATPTGYRPRPQEQNDGEPGDGGGGAVDPNGDKFSYRSITSMDKLDKAMRIVSAMQLGSLGKSGIAQGLGSAIGGIPERNQVKLGAITGTFRTLKEELGLGGKDLGAKDITQKDRDVIAAEIERVSTSVERLTTNIVFTKDAEGKTVSTETNKSIADTIAEVNQLAKDYEVEGISKRGNQSVQIGATIARVNAAIKDKVGEERMTRGPTITEYEQGLDKNYNPIGPSFDDLGQSDDQGNAPMDDGSNEDTSNRDDTSTEEDFNKGGLLSKKKPKAKKRMKQGGLASR